jgi:class 3 adenylate cyclase/tetratricopeptide (TPR) repeat protein
LVDFAGAEWADTEATRLEGLRLLAIEDRTEARLALGEHARLVPELQTHVAAHPFQEGLWGQLMLALYRSDRQADALRAYGRLRTQLGEELGIEPSAELARLEQAILLHEPGLDWRPPRAEPVVAPPVEMPAALPTMPAALPTGVVTFLLTDVVGSTRLWDEQPTAMADALLLHDVILGDAVRAHRGRVLKPRGEGDSLFAVFTRATDAVKTGVDAQRRLAEQAWPAGADLSVRIALHTGEAVERDGDYYGTTVNRAARLRGLAEGGHVLVSQSTAELLADHLPDDIELVDLGPRSLPGLRRPEHVYAARAAGTSATNLIGTTDGKLNLDSPPQNAREPGEVSSSIAAARPARLSDDGIFVGRHGAVRRLEEALKDANHGRRQFVLVTGEAGVGKTRLTAELTRSGTATDACVLYGRCEDQLGMPYQPFVEALRNFADICPVEVLPERLGRLQGELCRLLPELADECPDLPQPVRSDPETERYRVFEAVAGWLSAASRFQPIVIVLDDLHWATEPTLLLLRHVLSSPNEMHVLVLATYRDQDSGEATDPLRELLGERRTLPDVARVALTGLEQSDVAALFKSSDEDRANTPPDFTIEAVHTVTRGNPFFVRETIRHLRESGSDALLALDHASAAGDVGIPMVIQSMIRDRLRRLSPAARAFLDAAAVAGDDLDLRVLERVGHVENDVATLVAMIDEGVSAHVVVDEPGTPSRYRFVHGLVRHTLYAEISSARRAGLHRQVAEAIEDAHDDELDSYSPALAYHWAQAGAFGDARRVVRYSLSAGRQALDHLAYEETVDYVNRALEFEAGRAANDVERADLLLMLSDARYHLFEMSGMRDAALNAADAARRAGSPERLASAAITFGAYAVAGTLDDTAITLCREALAATNESELSAQRASLLAVIAGHLSWAGDQTSAEAMSKEALALARAAGDADAIGRCLWTEHVTLMGSARVKERAAIAEQLIHIGESAQHLDGLRQGLRLRAMASLASGHLGSFDHDARALEDFNEQYGGRFFLALAAMWRGLRGLLDGDLAATERAMEELLEYSTDDANFRNAYAVQCLVLWWEQGRYEEMAPLIAGAAAMNLGIPGLRAAHAWTALKLGDVDTAKDVFLDISKDDFAEIRGTPLWPSCLPPLAELGAAIAPSEIVELLHASFAPFAGQMVVVATGTHCWGAFDRHLAILATSLERYDEADARFQAALNLEESLPAPPLVARTLYWYAWMLHQRRQTGDREHAARLLREATTVADRLGLGGLRRDCEQLAW